MAEFGEGDVADRLLAKWISDPDAGDKWEHLWAVVEAAPEISAPTTGGRPYRYWVVLWYFSMGYRRSQIAEQMGVADETIKQQLKYARARLNLAGEPMARVVAEAIRQGLIP